MRLALLPLLWAMPLLLWAQAAPVAGDSTDQAERARIERSRQLLDAEFAVQERNCYTKFAVNDCLLAERARRRAALADLRRQENLLNDAERRRRAAEQIHRLEQKAAPVPAPPLVETMSPKAPV